MTTFDPSQKKLVLLLNSTFLPPQIFNESRISFGTPVAVTASDHDTEIVATGIPGQGYWGDATIKYTRVPLSRLAGVVSVYSTTQLTLASVVAAMNAEYGTFLTENDFVPQTLPTLQLGDSATVTLVAASTSVGWVGQVDITIAYGLPKLASVVGSKAVKSLKFDSYPYPNGRDFFWDTDFSSCRDFLKPQVASLPFGPAYVFTNYAKLMGVIQKLGAPPFGQPDNWTDLQDQATSAVPDSNQKFDRVVTMRYAPGGHYGAGPLYFHYNLFDKA